MPVKVIVIYDIEKDVMRRELYKSNLTLKFGTLCPSSFQVLAANGKDLVHLRPGIILTSNGVAINIANGEAIQSIAPSNSGFVA